MVTIIEQYRKLILFEKLYEIEISWVLVWAICCFKSKYSKVAVGKYCDATNLVCVSWYGRNRRELYCLLQRHLNVNFNPSCFFYCILV